MIYRVLGFWPTVASMLLLCIVVPAVLAIKLYKLRSREERVNEDEK
jgi:hypothetical protein